MKMVKSDTRVDPAALGPVGEVLDFMRVMWAVDHALQKASKQMKSTLGVTGPQRLVIRIVGRFPGASAAQLADLLHIDPSTLTGVLTRLERRGLIQRRRDPHDGRRWLLGLTPRGRMVDARMTGTIEATVQSALRELHPDELDAARKVFTTIAERLETAKSSRGGGKNRRSRRA